MKSLYLLRFISNQLEILTARIFITVNRKQPVKKFWHSDSYSLVPKLHRGRYGTLKILNVRASVEIELIYLQYIVKVDGPALRHASLH